MCNGQSSRTREGGTIVILKPNCAIERPVLKRESSLRLTEDPDTRTTVAQIDGLESDSGEHQVIIHRDGDLRSTGTGTGSGTILHRFSIPTTSKQGEPFDLQSKLDLGVGDAGIVGRRVSLLVGQLLIGTGIVGWN